MWLLFYSLDSQSDALLQEVELDFTRAMNRIVFDQTVQSNPATFPFVTLPDPVVVTVPEKGELLKVIQILLDDYNVGKCPDIPSYPFKEVRDKFQFLSLQTSTEVIKALCHVRDECGKVTDMNLFHTGGGKHLRLEEFDQTQSQATMQVHKIIMLIHTIHSLILL